MSAAAILVALLVPPASAADSGALPDVLIQAEEKRPVAREKPELIMAVKEDAPLEALLETEDDVRFKIPSEISQSTAFAPPGSDSPLVAVPSGSWLLAPWKGAPVRVFFPARELAKAYPSPGKDDRTKGRWELVVVDTTGKMFRKFGGEGLPPERIDFDGKGDDGGWLRAGHAYTPVLTFHDAGGRARTAVGRPFALAGLSLQDPAGPVIRLAPRALFAKDPGQAQLSEAGAGLLREAAVLIQRHYPGLALEVSAKLNRKDAAWAQAAAELCAKDLAKRLLLPTASVAARGQSGAQDLEETVDVRIVNR